MQAVGLVFIEGQKRPIVSVREIRRGRKKGSLEVSVSDRVERKYNMKKRTVFVVRKEDVRFF